MSSIPLVFIPGMMCDRRLFSHQIMAFEKDREVLVAETTRGASMEALAQDIFSQIPWNRFALAGLSMGGIIAMEMLRQDASRIVGTAFMDTNPWAEKEEVKAARQQQIRLAEQQQHLTVITEQVAPKYGTGSEISPEDQLNIVIKMAISLGADTFIQQSKALAQRPDQIYTLTQYYGPSIVLCGENDLLCPFDRHQAIHDCLLNSQLHIVPSAGHLITLQAPTVTNSLLKNWLETL